MTSSTCTNTSVRMSGHHHVGAICCQLSITLVPQVTAISDLTDGGQDHPYGEVDVVGVVIHVSSTVMATARLVASRCSP